MAASRPSRSGTLAAMRGGIEARPAERSAIARATASRRPSGSRSRSTSARVRTSTCRMLGGGRFLLAPHDERTEAHARADHFRSHDEPREDESDAEEPSEEERPGDAKTVQAAGHAGNGAAERDEKGRRDAGVELAPNERDRRSRQRGEEVHRDRDRSIELGDRRWKRPASQHAALRHEDVRAEDGADDERERVERAKEEARGDEVAESGSREQHDRARAEISRHEEGADQVPGPIEHLVPAECRAEELGAGADAVPEEADRPDQLEPTALLGPLREHGGGEDEAGDGGKEREYDVRAHRRTIRRARREVNRDAQVCGGATKVRSC